MQIAATSGASITRSPRTATRCFARKSPASKRSSTPFGRKRGGGLDMPERAGSTRGPRLMRVVYRAILCLYPRRVRDRLADDQLRLFEELWIHERPRSLPASTLWTARACGRALLTAFALRRDERARGR